MKLIIQKFCLGICLSCAAIADDDISNVYKGEEDFYKGAYAADGDYILNGGLIKDLPKPIKVPVHYKAPGFDASKLTPPPAPGIHPRILIGPDDIERFKKIHKSGKKAPRIFRVQMEEMRRVAEKWKIPRNFEYRGSPWGAESRIGGWGLYALITDNKELGRKAAKATVQHALYMEGRLDILNEMKEVEAIKDASFDFLRTDIKFGQIDYHSAYYQGGLKRVKELMKKHGATVSKKDVNGSYLTLAFEYDYNHPFMTEQERTIVRRVISKSTFGKYSTGMQIPGQMYINNHMSGASNLTYLALAIEGEKGYDPRIAKMAVWALTNKLSYDLSSDGITYENNKGFIPMLPILAVAKRQGPNDPKNLLKHSHLLARANSNVAHARKLYYRYFGGSRRRPDNTPLDKIITGQDQPRYWRASGGSGTGGHLEFWLVLKHFYPKDSMVDFVWNCKLPGALSYYEGTEKDNWGGKIHYSYFAMKALNLLTATQMTDYNKLDKLKQFDKVQKHWFDKERGIMSARNDWSADSMLVHLENRVDQFYMGHESPQHGDFQLWADGISWVPNGGGYLDTTFRNVVTVDGLAGVYAPVSGDSMTAFGTEHTATTVSEMTTAYQWRKSWNGLRYLDHPGLKTAPYQMTGFANAAYQLNRFSEFAYLPRIKEHYDGFAHLDYGPWHGETRGPEYYVKWNDPMDHVYRTLHFARGKKPYMLIMDDLRKADNKDHQFDWRMLVTADAVLYKVSTAVANRHVEMNTEGKIGTDMIFCMKDASYRRAYSGAYYVGLKPSPKKGDPMLLVRVLWRNTNFPYPVPNIQRSGLFNMVSVPAFGKSPEYRIMVFPHHFGDKLPSTEWSDDRTRLTVKVGGNVDVYDLDQTDSERTVFSMSRNGKKVTDSGAKPPKPELVERAKFTIDRNRPDWRAAKLISGPTQVLFVAGKFGAEIRYTLDGSEPGISSSLASRPITIDKSCVLKARTYRADWRFGKEKLSDTVEFRFVLQKPQAAVKIDGAVSGLRVQGYEIKTTEFDKKGFFQGSKNSLPKLELYKPLATKAVADLTIPVMDGTVDGKYMTKAFYTFDGYIEVPKTGAYSFELTSNGPVDFKVGGKQVILVDKQFGTSYKPRYGEVVLQKGWHPLHITVCDPVFWKGDAEKHYAISLKALAPSGADYETIASERFMRNKDKLQLVVATKKTPTLLAASKGVKVVPGLIEKRYDRLDILLADYKTVPNFRVQAEFIPTSGFKPAYYDLKGVKPYFSRTVDMMERNDSPRKLVEYSGYLRISRDGVYTFSLRGSRSDAAQLIIGKKVVERRQVDAPKTDGIIALAAGLHPFKLQIAMGQAVISVKHETDKDFQVLSSAAFARDKAYQPPKSKAAAGKEIPGLLGIISFEKIVGESTPILKGNGAVALVQGATIIPNGVKGKALALYGEVASMMIRGLKQREDAFTVATWVMFKNRTEDLTVWGEGYGPVLLQLRGTRASHLKAEWGRGVGRVTWTAPQKMTVPGKWFHVAATYGKENVLYFNGKKVQSAQALHWKKRIGNGYFADHNAVHCSNKPTAFDEYRMYDRTLTDEEIQSIYESERKK
ncbi:MAG: chitobiase/beta-hexosaminidase C-terminal domain-containing protein, partial [Lentisphaeria bacterium]|nr:PA14 domain-containing protein [Lentisphaeria bacterium]NQZ70036.1 chitobiase/beta-hexosaminidase C-terminal domain-containing protein [Lentisphaeria bacterium]